VADTLDFINEHDDAPAAPAYVPGTDAGLHVQKLVGLAVEYERRRAQLERALEALKASQVRLLHEELPAAMDTASLRDTTFAPGPLLNSNHPVSVQVVPFYRANIAADWDEERRTNSFNHLNEIGAADLIKVNIIIPFGRSERGRAMELAARLAEAEYVVTIKEGVHNATLTSWLKEKSRRSVVSQETLDHVGGFVGRIASVKIVTEG
jgi:hypothetical protein